MSPLSFIIVGSGWRAMFYVRIARAYPKLFTLKYLLCRTEQKAERIRREQEIPVTTSIADCEAAHPDFVVLAVDYASNFQVTVEWLQKGYAVLAETPAASTEEHLEALWRLHQKGARLQIAEQYFRYPVLAAGLQAIQRGLIGDPYAVELSLAHDYHGFSLIRRMLNCGLTRESVSGGSVPKAADCGLARESVNSKPVPEAANCGHAAEKESGTPLLSLPLMKLSAHQYRFPVVETDSRFGPVKDGRVGWQERTRVTIAFDNGKVAFYDFSGVQYHSFIRARHINVQGVRGEWNDTILRYVDDSHQPRTLSLCPWLNPAYQALDTEALRRKNEIWTPTIPLENDQDEYAIATLMLDMRALLETGQGGYPLAEALEDAYTLLLMRKALEHPGQEIASKAHSWQRG